MKKVRLNANQFNSMAARNIQSAYHSENEPARMSLDAICNLAMRAGWGSVVADLNIKRTGLMPPTKPTNTRIER